MIHGIQLLHHDMTEVEILKIGLFLNTQSSGESSLARQIRDSAEQTRAARDAGFDLIGCGEHYLSAPYQMAAALPFLARMAGKNW